MNEIVVSAHAQRLSTALTVLCPMIALAIILNAMPIGGAQCPAVGDYGWPDRALSWRVGSAYNSGNRPSDYGKWEINISGKDYLSPTTFIMLWDRKGTELCFYTRSIAIDTIIAIVLTSGVLVVLHAIDLYRIKQRILLRTCVSCGYNLTGSASERCPECGARVLLVSGSDCLEKDNHYIRVAHARRRWINRLYLLGFIATLLSYCAAWWTTAPSVFSLKANWVGVRDSSKEMVISILGRPVRLIKIAPDDRLVSQLIESVAPSPNRVVERWHYDYYRYFWDTVPSVYWCAFDVSGKVRQVCNERDRHLQRHFIVAWIIVLIPAFLCVVATGALRKARVEE